MRLALVSVALLRFAWGTAAFVAAPIPKSRSTCVARWATTDSHEETWPSEPMVGSSALSRRSALAAAAGGMTAALVAGSMVSPVQAAVGNLPEYQDTNVILQGLTIQVSDRSQLDQMVNFLRNGFDFKIVRQRAEGAVLDVWLAFGPEELDIPKEFTAPVSSFGLYGGHASIHLQYDERTTSVYYREGSPLPGDNIAFLQLGLPSYRISQMIKYGGNIVDAYGIVNVISPAGLPIRGIVGISPDPIMFVAVNSVDIEKSTEFYNRLGFVEQEYPYCRPSKGQGQIEPAQPKGSVYLAPSPNSMGVLLLKAPKRTKSLTQNPAIQSLNFVYSPRSETSDAMAPVNDPSGVTISFETASQFVAEERIGRSPRD